MKLVQSLIVAALVAVPVVSFAQSQPQQALTRAEVRAEVVQLQKAGYSPASDNAQYPQNIEAAEARVSGGNDVTGYGGVANGGSASGSHVPMKHAAANAANDGSNVVGLGAIYAHS
ncbi:DUF4148 domain-containing protein [Paraburkholderia sp. HD33-4]|uniref:DUF4148 domain-containing protein n=1 Tax=Paraburkholderia sp. HD33-4 TaxID=2883242 RepID=UPI001F42DA59|nr:DUF4148 domain-containing protein [Paraburkholderia sp. HD33-4]